MYPELFGKEQGFLEVLPEYFNIEKERRVTTEWIYPNPEEALKMLKFKMEAFYGKRIIGESEKEISTFVKVHENSGKVYLHANLKVLSCSQGFFRNL